MRLFRLFVGNCYFFGTVLGLGMISAGCDDSGKTEMKVPEKPVAESQKDSMDAYKADMAKRKGRNNASLHHTCEALRRI